MSKSILKPIHQLSNAAEKISSGNLDFSFRAEKKDELGKLIDTFDHMRERLKTSQELRDRYERNRKELIANISHDLKTPITSIRGYVEGIKDGVPNTKGQMDRYLDTIQSKAEYMDLLIDELSLYSKLDVKSISFHFKRVDLKALIEDYVEELRQEFNKENIRITLSADEPITVSVDSDKLIRAMNNIVYNSVKYNDKEICQIHISLQDKGRQVEVGVLDNGPGVSDSELSTIFSRFYRADPSRNTHTGGSGLGLAIAAQIIEAHGGKIWAEHAREGGLAVFFTIPKHMEQGDEVESDPNH